MVGTVGLEPTRDFSQRILSPYIPCELPGTCWYVLEFKVSKNAVKIGLFVLRQTEIS